jgi:hypothetical protein
MTAFGRSSCLVRGQRVTGCPPAWKRLSVGLLQNEMPLPKPVRLLGVSLSSLQAEVLAEPQLDLPI